MSRDGSDRISGDRINASFFYMLINGVLYTPPKTNMEPKNVGFEDDFPFQRGDFQVPC